MKKFALWLCALYVIPFCSCVTAIKLQEVEPPIRLTSPFGESRMEFIGYKIDTNTLPTASSAKTSVGLWARETDIVPSEFDQAKILMSAPALKQLGFALENSGIATNKSASYFGIYSLQELELYKSDKRYVSFVEVERSKLDYKENKSNNYSWGGVGSGFLLGGIPLAILGAAMEDGKYTHNLKNFYTKFGIGCSIAGLLSFIPALIPAKTTIDFNGLYNVYIYDTETKALIRKDSVSVVLQKKFTGAYTYDESSKAAVHTYLSSVIANKILQKYDELNKWLATK